MTYALKEIIDSTPRLKGEIDPTTAVPAPPLTEYHAEQLAREVEESERMLVHPSEINLFIANTAIRHI